MGHPVSLSKYRKIAASNYDYRHLVRKKRYLDDTLFFSIRKYQKIVIRALGTIYKSEIKEPYQLSLGYPGGPFFIVTE